jgi:prepilin-type N-terminal cleavage/methylation domain-containing protein
MTRPATRRGVTLVELLVTVVILAILGTGLTRLMTAQALFYEHQGAGRTARAVSRAAVNVLLSEMRMVEVPGGIVAASPTSVTFRVPYAVGLVCGPAAGGTTITVLPADSAMFAEPGFSGYAWRNGAGTYTYVEVGAAVGTAAAAACTAANVTPVPGGRLLNLAPAVPAAAGSAVILFRPPTSSPTRTSFPAASPCGAASSPRAARKSSSRPLMKARAFDSSLSMRLTPRMQFRRWRTFAASSWS